MKVLIGYLEVIAINCFSIAFCRHLSCKYVAESPPKVLVCNLFLLRKKLELFVQLAHGYVVLIHRFYVVNWTISYSSMCVDNIAEYILSVHQIIV